MSYFLFFAFLGILLLLVIRIVVVFREKKFITDIPVKNFSKIAVVYGAGLRKDGSATQILKDRVSKAVSLYKDGFVEKLLLTGAGHSRHGNEVAAMENYALELGVDSQDLLLDGKGNRSIDSCFHIKSKFGFQKAYLVTQYFHLPRTLLLAKSINIDCLGIPSNLFPYPLSSKMVWSTREVLATFVAVIEILFIHAR